MTEERRAALAEIHQQTEGKDHKKMLMGQLVDGVKRIEAALEKPDASRDALPEMAMAGRGKGRRLAVR